MEEFEGSPRTAHRSAASFGRKPSSEHVEVDYGFAKAELKEKR